MDAYPLKGGLDLRTGAAMANPGTLADCLNYEVANVDGYSRISGFGRFDGQFRVAEFRAIRLRGALTGTFAPGAAVSIGTATGYVTQVDTALYVLMHSRDAWPLTLPMTVTSGAASLVVTAADLLPAPVGKQSVVNTARKMLADAVRPDVGIVPGNPAMPVAGMFWFKNRLYAIRDFPLLWFESTTHFAFRVGDEVAMPGGIFTVIAINYTSDAYLAGYMVLWPLRTDGTPMTALPQSGDLLTHTVGDVTGFTLGGAALGELPMAVLGTLPGGDTSAMVTATAQSDPPVTDEPVMRAARTTAGLWKATSTGWWPVDLKREAQFSAGTAAFVTFIAANLGVNAAPLNTGAKFCGSGVFNGTDVTGDVDADDGTVVALSGNASDELRVTGFDFSAIPDTATIMGIEVRIKRDAAGGGKTKDSIIELVGLDGTSTNKASVVEWDTTLIEVAYGGSGDTWGNDNITPAVVKAASFGARLVTQAVDATPSGGIDCVKVTVTYRRRDAAVFVRSGSTDIPVNLVDVQLVSGAWADGDAAGWLVLDIPGAGYGVMIGNGMQLRSAPGGAGDLLATVASGDTPIRLPGWTDLAANRSRYQFLASNFYGMADYRAVYGVSGASPAFTFDGSRWLWIRTPVDPSQDLPRHIARQGSSLVLGYYAGAYILSAVGKPTDFLGVDGATSIEIGERLTGLLTAMGDALLVTSQTQTLVLHGTTPDDYNQQVVSGNRGALEYTAADVGRLIVTDVLGVAAADATQTFGDLARTYISKPVQAWLAQRLRAAQTGQEVLCAVAVRYKNQYRLYFADGYVLTATANEPVEFTLQRYYVPGTPDTPLPLAAICTGIDEYGRERIFASFDADNRDYVFELDHGASFDGQPIPASFTLNPLSFSDSVMLKRFDRMFLLGQAEGYAALKLSRAIGYDMPDGSKASAFSFGPKTANAGPRAVRGEVDAPVEGYEISVRIDSTSDVEGPHTLQAISTIANARGASRGHVRG